MGIRTWLPALGTAFLIGIVSCTPRDEAAKPDAGAAAVETEPDAASPGADDAATAGAAQAMARATLIGAPDSGVSGTVEVTEQTGGVKVVAHITGVKTTGPLGLHVHETGVCTPPDFESAGGHFNPSGAAHACPSTTPRHAGDLGNIEIGAGGDGHLDLETDLLTVADGSASVVGKAIVLHDGQDDCATQPSGGMAKRLACGVLERVTR